MNNVPNYTIVGGVPAKPIRERFPEASQDGLKGLARWDWPHEKLRDTVRDSGKRDVKAFIECYRQDR